MDSSDDHVPSAAGTFVEGTLAWHVHQPSVDRDGNVRLHFLSCVRDSTGCCCDKVWRGQYPVIDNLLMYMQLDFWHYARLFVGPDDNAKLAMLQEMKAFAKEKLHTTMPHATLEDVKAIQHKLEQELEPGKYPGVRKRLGL